MDDKTTPRWRMPCVWFSIAMIVIASLASYPQIPPWAHTLATWLVTLLGSIGSIMFPGWFYQGPANTTPNSNTTKSEEKKNA